MILPTKHVTPPHSLIAVGALLLTELGEPCTVSRLWHRVRACPQVRTFQRFVLVLDMLFALGAIDYEDGLLRRHGA
jgi:hypothetical protein